MDAVTELFAGISKETSEMLKSCVMKRRMMVAGLMGYEDVVLTLNSPGEYSEDEVTVIQEFIESVADLFADVMGEDDEAFVEALLSDEWGLLTKTITEATTPEDAIINCIISALEASHA